MKVLVLEQLFPLPADSGGKIKSLCTIRALASEHDVCVLSYVRTESERARIAELQQICHRVEAVPFQRSKTGNLLCAFSSALSVRPFIVARDFRREMLGRVRQLIEDFGPDVIHIDHLQMAQFVDFHGPYRTVLDQHNVESMIIKRIAETDSSPLMRVYAKLEWPKLLRWELDVCRRADLVLTVSDEDAATLLRFDSSLGNFASVPIGIDVDSTPVVARNPGSTNILFLGTMYWPPNIDSVLYFCREILPMVRTKLPGCTFTVAGQRPPRAIQRLAGEPGVRVMGYVSDASVLAADCGVFVVPLRSGSGVRVKILNAMAMGLPVVSTSIGAEGLAGRHREHLLIADNPADFAEAVVDVLTNPSLAGELARRARELVEREYSWNVVGRKLLSVYRERLCGSGGRKSV
ncbi:MAG: glycosyltransferase family 4 protein [Armatimonadota bacterium]